MKWRQIPDHKNKEVRMSVVMQLYLKFIPSKISCGPHAYACRTRQHCCWAVVYACMVVAIMCGQVIYKFFHFEKFPWYVQTLVFHMQPWPQRADIVISATGVFWFALRDAWCCAYFFFALNWYSLSWTSCKLFSNILIYLVQLYDLFDLWIPRCNYTTYISLASGESIAWCILSVNTVWPL